MQRKVIQLAGKTLVVSLPIKWVERYNIKKGDEIDIDDAGSFLKIVTKSQSLQREKNVTINLRDGTRITTRAILSGLYKQGYDEITVEYNNKEVYDSIQEKRREVLLGFTIHELSKNKLTLGSFTQDSPKEFERSFRRAFLVTMSMGENLLAAIKNKDFRNLKEIRLGENTNNQMTSYCERLINKGFVDPGKASFYYVTCWNLEKVCDPYQVIISLMESQKKISFSEDTIKLFEIVNIFLKKYYDALYNYSMPKLIELDKDKKSIQLMAKSIFKNKNEFECLVIMNLFEIAVLTANFSGPFSALNIEKLAVNSS